MQMDRKTLLTWNCSEIKILWTVKKFMIVTLRWNIDIGLSIIYTLLETHGQDYGSCPKTIQ